MDIYSLYQQLKNDQFSLFYMGEFDDDLTELLMRIQETSSDEGKSIKKRMSYLIAECFQNIIRHGEVDLEEGLNGAEKFFMMRNIAGGQYLATANPIENSNVEKLAKSIDSLQNLSQEEIRKIYLESLGNNKLTAKGGGGLGLIEMARKTKNAPTYKFEKLSDKWSNFFMQIRMNVEDSAYVKLEDSIEFYERLLNDKIVLIRKGDFSQESILPLFKLFESNLQIKNEDLVFKKKSLYILIELLQNMNRHAALVKGVKEGLFIVAVDNGVYTMKTGNFISKEKANQLKPHLESLVGLDKTQLAQRYKRQLMENSISEDQGAGIGVIEMFRQSSGEIQYQFNEVSENLCFYSFSATL